MNRVASKAFNTTMTYAIISAVFLFVFAEELGYVIYDSYSAGHYISTLAVVVPIMYLDHVTDSMLKGIGEQVFSMWVNITDSLLSVILVWFLIPKMGIMGYAVVIIIMEGYNFLLSFLRLRRKISFKITPIKSAIMPLLATIISTRLALRIFRFSGSCTSPLWLVLKIVFALCITLSALALLDAKREIFNKKVSINK